VYGLLQRRLREHGQFEIALSLLYSVNARAICYSRGHSSSTWKHLIQQIERRKKLRNLISSLFPFLHLFPDSYFGTRKAHSNLITRNDSNHSSLSSLLSLPSLSFPGASSPFHPLSPIKPQSSSRTPQIIQGPSITPQ